MVISEQIRTTLSSSTPPGKYSMECLNVDPHQFLSNVTKVFPDRLQDVFYLHYSSPAAEQKPPRQLDPSTNAHEAILKHLAEVVSSCN